MFTCALLAGAGPALRAQTMIVPPASVAGADAAKPTTAVPAATWLGGATLRTVLGYSDNVLWSPLEREGRGFVQAELEAFAWRPARGGWEAKAMLSGEARRYASPAAGAHGEQRWVLRGEAAVTPLPALRIALVPQAFFADQVYDLSADIARRFVAQMRVGGVAGTLQAQVSLPRGWELEPAVQQRATDYFDFAEDYSETKAGARLRWRRGRAWAVTAAIYDHARDFRDRVNYTAGGRALPGTRLRFEQTSVEAGVRWTHDGAGRWTVAPTYVFLANRDRASGFFDYDQERVRCELSWQRDRWRVEAEASAGRYDYLVQTVGMGLAPPARIRDDFAVVGTVELSITARWKALARYAWERSRTNELNASYHITTAAAGVAWVY